MRLQVAGALLLVSIGAFAAGCGSGVYGSAATFETPQPPAPGAQATASAGYLLAHSSVPGVPRKLQTFESPWASSNNSTLAVGSSLVVRPAPQAKQFGALALVFKGPASGPQYRYSFDCWIKGSGNLRNSTLNIRIQVLAHKPHTPAHERKREQLKELSLHPVPTTTWQHFTVTTSLDKRVDKHSTLRVIVFVQDHVKSSSWLKIYGGVARESAVATQ